jgi:hypothetical protein
VLRRKACVECVRSKVRCNSDPTGCSRCATKGISCTNNVVANGRNIVEPLAFETDGGSLQPTATLQLTNVVSTNIPPQSSYDFRLGVNRSSVEAEETRKESSPSLTSFTWDDDIFIPEWAHALDLTTSFGEGYPLGSHFDHFFMSSELESASNIVALSKQSLQPSLSIPRPLISRDSSSLFERRKFSQPELEHTTDLALHILHSYTYVIASQGSLPPFIHPKYKFLSENDTVRPSPLDAAMNLAKMLLHGQRMNKSLIWGLIRIEQERLFNQVLTEISIHVINYG